MSLQDISQILSSREGLDLIVSQLADHDDPGSATESSRYSIQGPDGKFYQPLPLQSTPTEKTEQQNGLADDNYEYGLCGLGVCKPKWSQRLANLNVFAVAYGIAGIWMITLSSFLGSQTTSIERHLGMTTSKTGLILSSNEIGYLVFVILGSHLGKYTHIPVFLAISGIIFGLSTVFIAFGRLETPRVWQDTTASGLQTTTLDLQDNSAKYLCNPAYSTWDNSVFTSTNSSTLSLDMSVDLNPPLSISWVFYLLMFCSMIGGAVKSYRLPLLTYYIESNVVNKDRSAMLLGISVTAMILGPPIAMFLGGFCSSLSVDLKETTMSKYDQRWVGAWWLGFTIIGLACIVCSVPILFFPRHMRKLKAQNAPGATDTTSLRVMMIDLPKSLGRCFRRPIYVLALLFSCIEGFAFAGSFAYNQKYMETQFNKTAQEISTISGVLTLFTIVLGTFSGGWLTTKLKLGLRGCAVVTLAVAVVTLLIDSLNLVFGCKNSDIVGFGGNRTLSMDACDCSQDVFIICGENQVNYLSPCVAGCRNGTSDMVNVHGYDSKLRVNENMNMLGIDTATSEDKASGRNTQGSVARNHCGLSERTLWRQADEKRTKKGTLGCAVGGSLLIGHLISGGLSGLEMFTNCTGINDGQAKPGMCDLDCHFLIPYLVVFGLGTFLGTSSIIPGVMLSVRSVELRDQSLASGTSSFCQTLIGILPSPIFFGKIIDMSCSLWSPTGSCMLYDRERFRYLYMGIYLGLRFVSLGVLAALLWLAHRDVRRDSSKQPEKTPAE